MNQKGIEYSKNGAELRKKQKELVDTILTQPEQLENIINIQLASRNGFHQYSLNNIYLADWQLWARTGETAELLAPYSKWQRVKLEDGTKIHRNVKKGEKALRILAPYTFTITEEDKDGNEVEKTVLRFKSVPVFDLSQTEGDPFEVDFTSGKYDFALDEITSRINVPFHLSNKEITRGYTDGKDIWVSKNISVNRQICTFFHELAHYLLHFDSNRHELDTPTKELEAEAVSYLCSTYIGIENKESPAYIRGWTKSYDDDERTKLLSGKGSNVLKTATKIIEDLKLSALLDIKKAGVKE
jgi:antirestriction protein ArdC